MNAYAQIASLLGGARRIAVLTGAGISTASGIPDFRSRGGYYDTELPVEEVLSETYFRMHPKPFWTAFKSIFRLQDSPRFEPNEGHLFLRELELAGKRVRIMTQNVDDLHRKAGSGEVYDMHGTIDRATCPKCGRPYGLEAILREEIPRCERDSFILKPDVVLFEGRVKHLEEAFAAAREADVFLTLGSSLQVYPVRELPAYAVSAEKIIINRDPTGMDGLFQKVLHEDIVEAFRKIRSYL